MPNPSISLFRTDVTCRICKRLMRNLGRNVSKKEIAHTLVVIGRAGRKTVYLDVSREEAIRRYVEAHGNDADTRRQIEATEVFTITDQFGAHNIWPSPTRPRSKEKSPPEESGRTLQPRK